jgi:hypothetical protein
MLMRMCFEIFNVYVIHLRTLSNADPDSEDPRQGLGFYISVEFQVLPFW